MTSFLKTYGLAYCAAIIVLLLGVLHFYALPKITYKAEKLFPSGIERPILLPDLEPLSAATVMHIDYKLPQQTRFRVFSAGCIRRIMLNNITVPFNGRVSCDFMGGMGVDFAPFLHAGDNLLTIETYRPGNLHIGPLLFNYGDWGVSNWLGFCLVAAFCAGLILLLYRYTGEAISGCILSGGFLMYVYQFRKTTFMQYAMDMPAHLQYAAFIAGHDQLPALYGAREFYHPPLYYSIQALLFACANWLGSFDTVSVLRAFSLCCFAAFLIMTALILHRLVSNRLAYYTALLLMACYPSGIMFAARIDSNLLFYPLYAGCLYCLLRWLEEPKDRYLGMAFVLLGAGLATRSNALLLLPFIGLAMACQWGKQRPLIRWRSGMVITGLVTVLCGIALNFSRTAYYHYVANRDGSFIVSNVNQLPPQLIITNSWEKFLSLDVNAYFFQPFWSVWWDSGGRQYFWNSLLKSSLFGEFEWNQGTIGLFLSILLLALIAYVAAGAVMCWQEIRRQPEWWAFNLALFIPIVALIAFRWFYPFACSQDFRYIYPALIGFCGMFAIVMERHVARQSYSMAGAGVVLVIVFSTCSVLFFLTQ